MQIRALEAYQAMAKTSNSKVIFLPAPTQTMQSAFSPSGTSPLGNGEGSSTATASQRYDETHQDGFSQAITSKIIENI